MDRPIPHELYSGENITELFEPLSGIGRDSSMAEEKASESSPPPQSINEERVITQMDESTITNRTLEYLDTVDIPIADVTVEDIAQHLGIETNYTISRTWNFDDYDNDTQQYCAITHDDKIFNIFSPNNYYCAICISNFIDRIISIDNKNERMIVRVVSPMDNHDLFFNPTSYTSEDICLTILRPQSTRTTHRNIILNDTQYNVITNYDGNNIWEYLNSVAERYSHNEWELVRAKVSRRTGVPIAARRNNEVVVFFYNYTNEQYMRLVADLVRDLFTDNVTGHQIETVTNILSNIKEFDSGVSQLIDNCRTYLNDAVNDIRHYRDLLSVSIRKQIEYSNELEVLEENRSRVAVDQYRNIFNLGHVLDTIRPIRSHNIHVHNGHLIIEFDTYNLNMDIGNNEVLLMPWYRVSINTNNSIIEEAITITAPDVESGIPIHPHISTIACFGGSSTDIAESFGRRDWESVVRRIIPFLTRYNDRSPYYRSSVLAAHYFVSNDRRVGWVYPETAVSEETSSISTGEEANESQLAAV
jgi:hypothetical protein